MRERITFVHEPDDAFDPNQLRIENSTLYIRSVKGARENRLTFGFQELPQEIWRVLKQCHELHIRWSSPNSYASISPFAARVSPGLHVFFTPQQDQVADLLCPLLQKTFGDVLRCVSPEKSFTRPAPRSLRFSLSATYAYYTLQPSLAPLITYVSQKICAPLGPACMERAALLASADSLDIDFDSISHALTISAYHSAPPRRSISESEASWNQEVRKPTQDDKIEVGVLANEPSTEAEELKLGGFLAIVGKDEKPNPTLFSFPSRHHLPPISSSSPQRPSFHASFPLPHGLHPILRLTLPSPLPPPSPAHCALHTHLTLPAVLFPDKYQLSAPNFLAAHNLRAIRVVSGETDLEAPAWTIEKWGSGMLVELAPPISRTTTPRSAGEKPAGAGEEWHADIPLHLRYLAPAAGGIRTTDIPWPVVFWACVAEEGSKMATNPFDRVNLGYDGLFGPRTMFYHLQPNLTLGERARAENGLDLDRGLELGHGSGRRFGLVETLQVPVLATERMAGVELGTVLVVLGGVFWVLVKLGVVMVRRRVDGREDMVEGEGKGGGKKVS